MGSYRVWALFPPDEKWTIEVPTFRTKTEARAYVRLMRAEEPTVKREVRRWVFDEMLGGRFVKV